MSDLLCSNIFADMYPWAREIKGKVNKWDYIKFKSFCMAKETIIKMKREPTVWGNIYASDTSDKGLSSKTCEKLIWLNTRKTNNPIKKWAKDISRAHRHTKGCSASLATRAMQIKTTMRCHFTLVRMAIINK